MCMAKMCGGSKALEVATASPPSAWRAVFQSSNHSFGRGNRFVSPWHGSRGSDRRLGGGLRLTAINRSLGRCLFAPTIKRRIRIIVVPFPNITFLREAALK